MKSVTNEELKEFLIRVIEVAADESQISYPDSLEVIEKLESGHIFVGEWHTDLNDAPRNRQLLLTDNVEVFTGETVYDRMGKDGAIYIWRTDGGSFDPPPIAYAQFPDPPKSE